MRNDCTLYADNLVNYMEVLGGWEVFSLVYTCHRELLDQFLG